MSFLYDYRTVWQKAQNKTKKRAPCITALIWADESLESNVSILNSENECNEQANDERVQKLLFFLEKNRCKAPRDLLARAFVNARHCHRSR